MSASWATVLASVIVMLGALSVALIKSGRHEGRLEAILDRLTEVSGDHEQRIRGLEGRPRRR